MCVAGVMSFLSCVGGEFAGTPRPALAATRLLLAGLPAELPQAASPSRSRVEVLEALVAFDFCDGVGASGAYTDAMCINVPVQPQKFNQLPAV
jgi:hypothetical protein